MLLFFSMLHFCNLQGNVGLSGKPGTNVKILKIKLSEAPTASFTSLMQTCVSRVRTVLKVTKGVLVYQEILENQD